MSDLVRREELDTIVGSETRVGAHPSTPMDPKFPQIPGFQVIDRLGAGAMGEVYQAKFLETGEEVALKVMAPNLMDRPDLVKRFEREIKVLSKLRHPNIAGAISSGRVDDRLYLAMEYVRGPTFTSLLKVGGPFAEVDALRVTLQIAQALKYAWETSSLIHRDLKPSNLLAVPDGEGQGGERVKIIDFGLARSTSSEDMSMTMTGMVMGTPNYMSPEQIRGEKDLGPQADMYGLGCTLFHLLTGRLPYQGNAPAQVMAAHLKEAVPDPGALVPMLTPATRHLVMTCMAKDPANRYASYAPIITACEAALRTISLRDTTSIRLLRRPLVLSRPQRRAAPVEETVEESLFDGQYETARLRRHAKDNEGTDAYRPTVDTTPTGSEMAPPPKYLRPGSATEALAKATTQRVRNTTSVHKKHVKRTTASIIRSRPKPQSDQLEIPTTSITRRDRLEPIPEPPSESHVWAWVAVTIAIIGFAVVMVIRW